MLIREANAADWPAIRPFFREIVAAGETYGYRRDLGEAAAVEGSWRRATPARPVPRPPRSTGPRGVPALAKRYGQSSSWCQLPSL
jgi:hypothetical protein